MGRQLSSQYAHVILASGYTVLTAAISLGKLFHSSIMRILNECLKLFKVADTADTDLSLKQWLSLENRVQT